MTALRVGLLAAALTACGCSSDPVFLGQNPDIVWWTDHESGDFSDWNQGGKVWTIGGGKVDMVSTPARSGTHALRSVTDASNPSELSVAIATREGEQAGVLCYSAWYYLPSLVSATDVWLFFKFRSRQQIDDSSTSVEVWDLDVVPSGSDFVFSLYSHQRTTLFSAPSARVPVLRWFQLEACLLASNGADGWLTVWLDGAQLFRIEGPTAPTRWVEWNVGSVAQATTPAAATVYIDDAAVSTRQLGPDFPVFWRRP
ncbi:MAG: heparin lyase I family protein [Polyangiaceae bacterium]